MCVIPPPVALTVIVRVPVVARVVVLIVRVEVPDPGAAIDDGLNVAVSPLPSPDADRLIAELKLPEAAVVIFVVPELPRLIVNDVGEAETVNATGFDEVTVSVIVAVFVAPPPEPVTVIVYVPTAVVEATASVTFELPEPGAAIDVGLKPTVTPVGCPDADNDTAESKPSTAVLVTVDDPFAPCTTETELGEAESVNVGDVPVGASAVINPAVGLPHPVTRSKPVTAE